MAMLGRRFLNIVAAGKYNKPGLLSVHRLDVNHLFYPSASEALRSVRGDGDHELPRRQRPPETTTLQRLPAPCAIFSDASTAAAPARTRSSAFLSLLGSEDSRILFINEAGDSKMYYADKGCPTGQTHAMPSLEEFAGPVAFSVSVGGGKEREDSLYVMHGVNDGVAPRFDVLRLGGTTRAGEGCYWQSLPPPPFVSSDVVVDDDDDEPDTVISSYTMVDGGRTICVSSYAAEASTWCFDTAQREWWHAGDWEMPFEGRAEYLPDLGDLWLGVASGIAGPGTTTRTYEHGDLCTASGLSSLSAMAVNQPPTLLQRLYSLHDACVDWMVAPDIAKQVELINLGCSGRFAIARVFHCDNCFSSDWDYDPGDINEFDQLVITGVEIRPRQPRGSSRVWSCSDGLQLIPHKSISYMCEYNHKIHQVL